MALPIRVREQEHIDFLMGKGCTEEEAKNCWETAHTIVRAYGDGDLELGWPETIGWAGFQARTLVHTY